MLLALQHSCTCPVLEVTAPSGSVFWNRHIRGLWMWSPPPRLSRLQAAEVLLGVTSPGGSRIGKSRRTGGDRRGWGALQTEQNVPRQLQGRSGLPPTQGPATWGGRGGAVSPMSCPDHRYLCWPCVVGIWPAAARSGSKGGWVGGGFQSFPPTATAASVSKTFVGLAFCSTLAQSESSAEKERNMAHPPLPKPTTIRRPLRPCVCVLRFKTRYLQSHLFLCIYNADAKAHIYRIGII